MKMLDGIKKYKILIVDDLDDMREILQYHLSNDSYEILEATNGVEALKYLRSNAIDLLITDIEMPEMNGMQLCKIVFEEQIDTSTIIITCHQILDEAKEAFKYGVFDFITKPYDLRVVNNRVQLALERRDLEKTHFEMIKILYDGLGIKMKEDYSKIPMAERIYQLKRVIHLARTKLFRLTISKKS
ncbi:MAG: response regulator [Oligoflexia bacterium]|nr:response regulator [Oligoflexia bacterium]